MRINREEIFGPVAAVIRVKDYEEALAVANDTPFGLSAGIVTTSLKYASHFKRNSKSGLVMVNLPTAGLDYHVPFGGRKKSSYGPREQGTYAKEFYTIVKTAYVLPPEARRSPQRREHPPRARDHRLVHHRSSSRTTPSPWAAARSAASTMRRAWRSRRPTD